MKRKYSFVHKLCNATIATRECSIIKSSSIKSDGSDEYEHEPKMSLSVYKCTKFTKQQIEEELTTSACYMINKLKNLDVEMIVLLRFLYSLVSDLRYMNIVRLNNLQFPRH